MSELIAKLDRVITGLEKIRDTSPNPPDELYGQLDTLYDQKTKLLAAAIDEATPEYQKAAAAMNEAAAKTEQAVKALEKAEQAVKKVADVIGKVGELLSKLA